MKFENKKKYARNVIPKLITKRKTKIKKKYKQNLISEICLSWTHINPPGCDVDEGTLHKLMASILEIGQVGVLLGQLHCLGNTMHRPLY